MALSIDTLVAATSIRIRRPVATPMCVKLRRGLGDREHKVPQQQA